MKAITQIEEETKLGLQVQLSSLKSLTATHTDKIQELYFALVIRESLIKQEHQKNKDVYVQNMELRKKLDIAAKEAEVKEAQLKRLQTTLQIANKQRNHAEDTLQELLSDPLNVSALPSSDNNKWKEEIKELKTKLVSEFVQRSLLTQVFLDKEKASEARIQELERQLAATKEATAITTELPFPAIQASKLPIEGTIMEMEQMEDLEVRARACKLKQRRKLKQSTKIARRR